MKFSIILSGIWFMIVGTSCLPNNIVFAQDKPLLKEVFKDHFLIGAALKPSEFSEEDLISSALVKEHFNSVTAENILKWEKVHPLPDQYEFDLPDKFVSYGEENSMFIIGHTLVWHQQTPDWVFKNDQGNTLSRDELLNRMREHIYTVVERYKGRIKGWDVVNEALNEDGELNQSKWLNIIGEDYLVKAFQFANEADPGTELYYNDFSLENEPKRNGAIQLIKKLQGAGVKVDGIGLQGHYKMDWPSASQLDSTIKTFSQLGLKVMITELDVDVLPYDIKNISADITLKVESEEKINPYKNGLPDLVQKALAERYASLFKILIDNSSTVSRVTFWGVTDETSWLNNWPVEGRTNYPLLFDREGRIKPAFEAVVKKVKE